MTRRQLAAALLGGLVLFAAADTGITVADHHTRCDELAAQLAAAQAAPIPAAPTGDSRTRLRARLASDLRAEAIVTAQGSYDQTCAAPLGQWPWPSS